MHSGEHNLILGAIVNPTGGKIKWIEQIESILHLLAKFDRMHVPYIVKALFRKRSEELVVYKKLFIASLAHDLPLEEKEELWQRVLDAVPIARLRSHALVYALAERRQKGCTCTSKYFEAFACQCGKSCDCSIGTLVDRGCECSDTPVIYG